MKRENFNHGFTQSAWNAAKEEACKAMIDAAHRRDLIAYSDLAARITSCNLGPHDPRLAHMLGDISPEEDETGRGMLSVNAGALQRRRSAAASSSLSISSCSCLSSPIARVYACIMGP